MNAPAQIRMDTLEMYEAWKGECDARNECYSQIGRQWLPGGDIVAIDYTAAAHDAAASSLRDELLAELSRLTGLSLDQLHEVL